MREQEVPIGFRDVPSHQKPEVQRSENHTFFRTFRTDLKLLRIHKYNKEHRPQSKSTAYIGLGDGLHDCFATDAGPGALVDSGRGLRGTLALHHWMLFRQQPFRHHPLALISGNLPQDN